MALTELQLPSKTNLYNAAQNGANRLNDIVKYFSDLSEFIGLIDTADLDAIGVAAGQVRTDLSDFRVMLEELLAFYNGTSTNQTLVPAEVIDKIRSI